MIFDSKLNFHSHIREVIIKAGRGIGIIRFLSKYVSRDVLDQICKLYVRPHLDHCDIFKFREDKSNNVFREIRKCFRKTAKFEFFAKQIIYLESPDHPLQNDT